jgi:hypothetical protein
LLKRGTLDKDHETVRAIRDLALEIARADEQRKT